LSKPEAREMTGVSEMHRVTVPAEAAGDRLDRLLTAALPMLSRTRIKALIEAGCVTRDGEPAANPSAKVRADDTFAVHVPESEAAAPAAQAIPLTVVYEDADVIVIDKPAGMVVHPAPGSPDSTLVNALLAHCGDTLSGIGGVRRPGIVHRIDKDTSGLMVAAKHDLAHAGLAAQFAEHSIERVYRAVVWGVPSPRTGTVDGAIGRSPQDRKKMAVVGRGGKSARTHYRVQRVYGPGAALVECRLETGRTHQIRVHMATLGHPVLGDPVYARVTPARRRAAGDAAAFARQALHAAVLGFRHPGTGATLRFESDFPGDIRKLIATLESVEECSEALI